MRLLLAVLAARGEASGDHHEQQQEARDHHAAGGHADVGHRELAEAGPHEEAAEPVTERVVGVGVGRRDTLVRVRDRARLLRVDQANRREDDQRDADAQVAKKVAAGTVVLGHDVLQEEVVLG